MTRRTLLKSMSAIPGIAVIGNADQLQPPGGITIAIVNRSNTEIPQAIIDALQKQLNGHFAPIWGKTAALRLIAGHSEPDPGEIQCLVLEAPDLSGMLGYHFCERDGTPYIRVFAQTAKAQGQPVSAVLSHECMEFLANPMANSFVLIDSGKGTGLLYNLEVCDPVQRNFYEIDGVTVTNFVTPRFYLSQAPGPYDFLGILTAPLTPAAGGYLPLKSIGGLPSIFG